MSRRSEVFRERLAGEPGNPFFRFSLGQALLAEGEPAEAVEHLGLAAEAKSDWMAPRILLGKALLAVGRKDAARSALEGALRLAVSQGHEEPEAELRGILAGL
ncbi:MAG: molecular chaperone DnaJ [Opitutales bacterium]|jgi:Flp pilus assembly protein TadD